MKEKNRERKATTLLSTMNQWQHHSINCDIAVKNMNFNSKKVRKIISTIIILIIVLSMVVPIVLSAIMY